MAKRLPEIFIVGTMKGGTTILYDYITTHPRVLAGTAKEIHYFSLYSDRGVAWYLEHFPDRKSDVLSIDASPTYFDVAHTPAIPGFIKDAIPEAKVVLIVRDPIERAISHFHHMKLFSHKDLFADVDINEFFSRPLEACYTRQNPCDEQFDQILCFSLYANKFYSYARVFGFGNVLVVTNEELRAHSVETMRRVFAHCGLEWMPSELFGKRCYVTGSEKLRLDRQVHERLAGLFYPNYKTFCAAARVPYSEKVAIAESF